MSMLHHDEPGAPRPPAAPVIFLDVDGVLAHSFSVARARNSGYRDWRRYAAQIDRDCARRLRRIVDLTGAKLVLSSSWRVDEDHVRGLCEALATAGFHYTQMPTNPDDHTPWLPVYGRPAEIATWLRDHPTVIRHLVLDDDAVGDPTVLTQLRDRPLYHEGGLQDRHVGEALHLLDGQQ